MKALSIRFAVIAAAMLYTLQLSAQNASNPIQVALLRWYQANTAALINSCHAQGLAFDGSHIWAGCPSASTIQEFNSSDGAHINTISLGAGVNPNYLLYDGANVWAANSNGTVTEVSASTGAIVRTVTVGANPANMAFDGANVWVMNSGSNSVSIIQAVTGTVTSHALSSCNFPWGAIFDGAHVWTSCHFDNTIEELDSSGNLIGTPILAGSFPSFMAYDGSSVWVSDTTTSGTVTRINLTTFGSAVFPVGAFPEGIAFDTKYIWVANNSDGTVTKLLASTGALVATYPIATGASLVWVGFDGGNVWVVDRGAALLHKM